MCALLLGVHGLVPQQAIGGELGVLGGLAHSTIEISLDATLLRGYFNLDLDRQIAQKTISSGSTVAPHQAEWKFQLMTGDRRVLPFIQDSVRENLRLDPQFKETQVSMMDMVRLPKSYLVFDELGVILPSTFMVDVSKEEMGGIIINPLPAPFQLPPIAQPPVQSSAPDPLSLLMLSMGGIALLGWSRHKRKLSAQDYRRATT